MKRLIAEILSVIMLISLVPNVVLADAESKVLYEEHFESETIKDEIEAQQNGWSYGAANNAESKIAFQVEENEFGYPGGGKFFRFASTDWYKSMWTVLDLKQNGIYKSELSGKSESEAEQYVTDYLSNNISVSFNAKFESDGKDQTNEAYIRIKNADDDAIAEVRAYCVNKSDSGELVLKALNEEKNNITEYKIKDVDWTKENTDWHNFKIDFNLENNTFRIAVDGEVFGDTPHGSWIPAGKVLTEDSAEPCSIGQLKSIEAGHFWSGWWQCIGIDDIVLTEVDLSDQPVNTPDVNPTSTPGVNPTSTPVSTATPQPTTDPNLDFMEDFEGAGIEQIIKNETNGWSYDGADNAKSHINIWVGNNGSKKDNSLRFASDDWFKSVWLIMNIKENAVKKKTAAGQNEEAAEAEVSKYLSEDFKLSFDARFEQQGTDDNGSTHEQYIRIKGSDNHVIGELHLMNDTLGLIALNSDKTANEFYAIKQIDWSSGNSDWHNFVIYFSHEKNAYMIEVDGEVFKGTSHGRWIPGGSDSGIGASSPADLGTIENIEFGHSWSAYWQNMCIDNISMSKYEPIEDVYEIGSLVIRNEHGGTVLTKGSGYSADINAIGGETADTQLVWEYSADNKETWMPLEGGTVPSDATNIRVTVVCTSTDGKTAQAEAEIEIAESGEVDYVEIVGENFEDSGKEAEIRNQNNGWSISGQSNQVSVGTGFGGTRNSLRFASTASNVTNNLRLDLMKRGATNQDNDMLYLKLDYSFGLGSDDDTVNSASLAYVRIKDTNNKAFTTVSLLGEKMYMTYYDTAEKKNKSVMIAQGQDTVLDVWRTMELYLNKKSNKFCMLIDGKPVGIDGTKWFTPSDTIVSGIGNPNIVTGIGAIEIGQENSAWWENTCIDNISLQKCYLPSNSTMKVDGINIFNGYDTLKPIVTGGSVTAIPQTDENTVVVDEKYSWEYYNGASWNEMTGNTVPADAEKVRVNGEFSDVYAQTAAAQGEADVVKNSAPEISDISVTGKIEAGQTLIPKYTYSDADNNADASIFIWSQSRTANGTYKEISREKTYTISNKDVGSYITLTVIARDDYGVCGNTLKYVIGEGEVSLFDQIWDKISIPTEPSGKTISLPDKDEESGVTFKWTSSDTSVLSSSGVITRPKNGYKTVTLTCVATDKEGNTAKKTYAITIKGSSGTTTGSSGGSGGGGGSSGGSSINTAMIPHASAAPIVPWTDDENSQSNNGQSKKYFNDVDDGAWYASDVYRLKERGIVNGDENGNFRPNSLVTRAEFVKMIVDLLGIKDDDADCEFDDVSPGSWYYPYIASAYKFNIVRGIGNGNFGTESNISRQDMAVIAASAIEMVKSVDDSGDLGEFTDFNTISDYAIQGVKKARNAGIMQGSDNLFRPLDNTTRAEAARVIYMTGEYLK